MSRWDEFVLNFIMFLAGVVVVIGLALVAGDIYYRATSETFCTEMELTISDMKKTHSSRPVSTGKTTIIVSDTDYVIYCGEVRFEVSSAAYKNLSVGDNVKVIEKRWVRDGEVWNIEYSLKGE